MAANPQTFTRLPTVDASPSTQRAVDDIYNKLAALQAQFSALQNRVAILEKKP